MAINEKAWVNHDSELAENYSPHRLELVQDLSGNESKEFKWLTFIGGQAVAGSVEYIFSDGAEAIQPVKRRRPQNYQGTTYYDITTKKLIIGQQAYGRSVESGSHPADLLPLQDMLLKDRLSAKEVERKHQVAGWTKGQYIEYGKWLMGVVTPYVEKDLKPMNEGVLRRASNLGLGPGLYSILRTFGSTKNFYEAADLSGTHRLGAFSDWTEEQYIEYLQLIGEALGRKPTFNDLYTLSQRSTTKPTPGHIAEKFSGKRHVGIGAAIEQAGWPNVYTWKQEDYIRWGVDYMLANKGGTITASAMNFLSKKDVGPSARASMNNFGSLDNYKEQVESAYQNKLVEMEETKKTALADLEEGLAHGTMPNEVVCGIRSTGQLLMRYGVFKLGAEIGLSVPKSVALLDKPVKEVASALLNASGLSTREVRKIAADIRVEDYIWRPEERLSKLTRKYWDKKPSARRPLKSLAGDLNQLKQYPLLDQVRRQQKPSPDIRWEIKNAADNRTLPLMLLRGAESAEQITRRFARFQIVGELLPDIESEIKINIAMPDRSFNEFIGIICSKLPGIGKKDIQETISGMHYTEVLVKNNL